MENKLKRKLTTTSLKKINLTKDDFSNISLNTRNNDFKNDYQNNHFMAELNLEIPSFAKEFIKSSKIQIDMDAREKEKQLFTFEKDGKIMFGRFKSSYIRKYDAHITLAGNISFFHSEPIDKKDILQSSILDIENFIDELPASDSAKILFNSFLNLKQNKNTKNNFSSTLPLLVKKEDGNYWMILSEAKNEPIFINEKEGYPIVISGHLNLDSIDNQHFSTKFLLLKKDGFELNNIVDNQLYTTNYLEYPQDIYLLNELVSSSPYYSSVVKKEKGENDYDTKSNFLQLELPKVNLKDSLIFYPETTTITDLATYVYEINEKVFQYVYERYNEALNPNYTPHPSFSDKTFLLSKDRINNELETTTKFYMERAKNKINITNRYRIELENHSHYIDDNKNLFVFQKIKSNNKETLLFYPKQYNPNISLGKNVDKLFDNQSFYEKNILQIDSTPFVFSKDEVVIDFIEKLGRDNKSVIVQTANSQNPESKNLYHIYDSNSLNPIHDKNSIFKVELMESNNSSKMEYFTENSFIEKLPNISLQKIMHIKTDENMYIFPTKKRMSYGETLQHGFYQKLPIENNIMKLPFYFITEEQKTKHKLVTGLEFDNTYIDKDTKELKAILSEGLNLNTIYFEFDITKLEDGFFQNERYSQGPLLPNIYDYKSLVGISINGVSIEKTQIEKVLKILNIEEKTFRNGTSIDINLIKMDNKKDIDISIQHKGLFLEIIKKENLPSFISEENQSEFYQEIKKLLKSGEIKGYLHHDELNLNVLYSKNKIFLFKSEDFNKDEIANIEPKNSIIKSFTLNKTLEKSKSIINNKGDEFETGRGTINVKIEKGNLTYFNNEEIKKLISESIERSQNLDVKLNF